MEQSSKLIKGLNIGKFNIVHITTENYRRWERVSKVNGTELKSITVFDPPSSKGVTRNVEFIA